MKVEDEVRLERSATEVWAQVQEILAKKLKVGTFQSWIRTARLQELSGNEATLAVSNQFHMNMLNSSMEQLRSAFIQVVGQEMDIKLVIDATIGSANDYTPSIASISVVQDERAPKLGSAALEVTEFQQELQKKNSNLNSKYTFDSFVVGPHNQFCYSAAMAVASTPGTTYNPLFIYGGVGLGKTHIMHAIGQAVLTANPRMVVRYITSEAFTNDVITSIRNNGMIEFRKRYRQCDVLLIDDVQFIEGKESTQEELFHTFNTLREGGRQIVFSSDRTPKEMKKLEDRLRSRFEWGLIADMQAPNLETRLAILQKKCEAEKMNVSPAVLEYIASIFTNNIRDLEGALTRANAYASLTGIPLNIQTAASVLQVGAPVSQRSSLTMESIIGAVAAHYRVDTSDLRSAKRSKDLALPRHVAMFLAHDLLSMSHSRIGESFGNRKHSSVIYAIDKVKEEMPVNLQLSHDIQQIRRQLGV